MFKYHHTKKHTKYVKLNYGTGGNSGTLVGYADANWGGDIDTRRSTTGYIFLYAGCAVSWGSRLQRCVTLSSMEAEYVALGEACQELVWLRRLLSDMGEAPSDSTCIKEDNQSCIQFIHSERTTRRSKHIETKENYVKELYEQGVLRLEYCPTESMAADILTKPLGPTKIRKLSRIIGLFGRTTGDCSGKYWGGVLNFGITCRITHYYNFTTLQRFTCFWHTTLFCFFIYSFHKLLRL